MAIVGIGVCAVVTAAGCAREVSATSVQVDPGKAGVTIQVSLQRSQVVAGQDVSGEAVVTNTTGKPIMVQACPNNWLKVGIADARIRFAPAFTMQGCELSIRLAPGPNRFPITVQTTYQACTGPEGEPTDQMPACVSGGLTALPAGTYRTVVATSGLSNAAQGAPVTVTVLSGK